MKFFDSSIFDSSRQLKLQREERQKHWSNIIPMRPCVNVNGHKFKPAKLDREIISVCEHCGIRR